MIAAGNASSAELQPSERGQALIDGYHRIRRHNGAFGRLFAEDGSTMDATGRPFGSLIRCINVVVEEVPCCGLTSRCPWCVLAQALERTIQEKARVGPVTLQRTVMHAGVSRERVLTFACRPIVVDGESLAILEISESRWS